MQIFFEVFEELPRQGPGSRVCTERAFRLCSELPSTAEILDVGCGCGAQTFDLAEISSGSIVTMDAHAPLIERLRNKVAGLGLEGRVRAVVGDMAQPEFEPGSFDLVWSEGALYNIGIDAALQTYHDPLRPRGYMAFTEAVWRKENPPEEVRAAFADYAAMGDVAKTLGIIKRSRFTLIDHFPLPDEAWWDDFYTPMEARISELRGKYTGDAEALAILDEIANEPEMHRQHSDYYGYEFFVIQRDQGS
jgi:ubiquinone/menaquinone biosynthesis C-methylase UbiE